MMASVFYRNRFLGKTFWFTEFGFIVFTYLIRFCSLPGKPSPPSSTKQKQPPKPELPPHPSLP
jgi:hypothetical protein